jgi:hypothetical protein
MRSSLFRPTLRGFSGDAGWKLAADIRAFCAAARGRCWQQTGASDAQQVEAWLTWATDYADAIDPLVGALRMPESPEPSPDELRPYLRGWNPYGPS